MWSVRVTPWVQQRLKNLLKNAGVPCTATSRHKGTNLNPKAKDKEAPLGTLSVRVHGRRPVQAFRPAPGAHSRSRMQQKWGMLYCQEIMIGPS